MDSQTRDSFLYSQLVPLAKWSDTTTLMMNPGTKTLYIAKEIDAAAVPRYRLLTGLCDKGLPVIRAVVEHDGGATVLREYISGTSLAATLNGGHTVPRDIAVRYVTELCDGLSALHRAGLVHRDINPNNIIITTDGHAKIIDFGISRAFTGGKTSDTTILGTPGYAAPEQFGFAESDAHTDMYALGVLLNVMVTGKLPNEQTAGGAVGRVVQKCTSIDAAKRYRNMDRMKKDLQLTATREGKADGLLAGIPGLRSRNPVIVALAIIAYAAVFMLCTILLVRSSSPREFIGGAVLITGCIVMPYLLLFNAFGIWERIGFAAGSSRRTQRIVYSLFALLCFALFFVIGGEILP